MPGIFIKKDRIIFYGNTAGYIDDGKAVVDPMFHCGELNDFLTAKQGLSVEWINGVYDRLANGQQDFDEQPILKSCRIYQLKPEVDPMIKFIGYDELLQGGFEKPDPENYQVVYDGQLETNDLDAIFEKFNLRHPPDFQGHSLSMSDVIELYDKNGSEFHYVDRFGFQQIDFNESQQEQQGGQSMNL
ncbi:YodL domain-containing protein [Desulfosporosinus metallidurans]|uniref:YodL-like domain-containing protein n=1 Tax=Desulfosporosinus metallidurans TaxID=1888891 RepID=A0A1Q8QVQ8_9FIRM|nr:YodL domain-containing protein [Desulfosporosinus metallidurans]OLN31392.1 hypothetical protein DSOL_2731 [Desulfosporosinus metallidurans]